MTQFKTLAAAHKELNLRSEDLTRLRGTINELSDSLTKAKAGEKEAKAQLADLKERLYNSEQELARLNGYLSRVHEDDIVRDGLVEIKDEQGIRMVPKRPSPALVVQHGINYAQGSASYGSNKKTHWTNY